MLAAGVFQNIEFNPYSSVEGCLYVITEDELQVLDKCLGYPEVCIHCYYRERERGSRGGGGRKKDGKWEKGVVEKCGRDTERERQR